MGIKIADAMGTKDRYRANFQHNARHSDHLAESCGRRELDDERQ
jgi:hypothetical protein